MQPLQGFLKPYTCAFCSLSASPPALQLQNPVHRSWRRRRSPVPGGGRLGHRPLLAETPHRQEADPAPAAAGEGGEGELQHRQLYLGQWVLASSYQRIKAPCICLVAQQALGLTNMASAALVGEEVVCTEHLLNLKSDPSGYNSQKL